MNKLLDAPLFSSLNELAVSLEGQKLAEVFRMVSFEPKESYDYHSHQRLEINYVKRGSCVISLEEGTTVFREGELMIITSNVSHYFESGANGCTLVQLEFIPEKILQLDNNIFKVIEPNLFSKNNDIIKIVNNVRIARVVQRIVLEMKDSHKYDKLLVLMYYMELLILIHRYMEENYLPIHTNETMRRAIAYIQENYNKELLVQNLAQELSVSDRHLRSLFLKYLNISPNKYLNQLRINKAVDLMRITELSIKEICFRSGFSSPQYFSRIFKQYTGVSPNNFLNQ